MSPTSEANLSKKVTLLNFTFQLEKYSTTILSAMMAGMDDKDDMEDEITLEAMSGLAKILAKLDENNVRQILINICLRIRPCFEKVSPSPALKRCVRTQHTDTDTVKSLFSGHPRDLSKCPLNRGRPLNRVLLKG